MSEHYLQIAREFIQDKDYASARKVLNKIPDHPTAKKWLARIHQIEQEAAIVNLVPDPIELPIRLEVILRNHLHKGETVLWHEQPEPTIYSHYLNPIWMTATYLIVGFLLLAVFLYLQFGLTNRGVTPIFLIQISTPLIFIAAPFIRPFIAQRRATAIHYVLTDRQALIIEKLKVKPVSRIQADRIETVEERTGFRSVIFRRHSAWWNLIMVKIPVGFLGIAKADDVKRIIAKYWK
jgi:hypothetical protein